MANGPQQDRQEGLRRKRGHAQPRRERRALTLDSIALTTDVPDQFPILPDELDLLDTFFADLIAQALSSSA